MIDNTKVIRRLRKTLQDLEDAEMEFKASVELDCGDLHDEPDDLADLHETQRDALDFGIQ